MDRIARFFGFREAGTTFRTETVAGVTTFMTMAYIIFVNPSILANPQGSGMSFEGVLIATCVASFLATLLIGLYANYPIAAAPGMGLNAFLSFVICGSMGVPWQAALGMVLISGAIFAVLTVAGVWEKVIDAVPQSLKYATACGIGAFIAFIGFQHAGLVEKDPVTFVTFGDLTSLRTLLSIGGLVLTVALIARNIKGAILIGVIVTGIAGFAMGTIELVQPEAAKQGTFFRVEILETLKIWKHPNFIAPILILLFFDMFDTVGTLIGVGEQAGLMVDGRLPRGRQALLSDALGTCVGAALGTSTVTSYIESASGVSEGGRTGFSNVITALLFLAVLGLFLLARAMGMGTLAEGGAELAPITAPALIVVGTLMMANIARIPWDDFTEAFPAFLVIILMPLTYNISTGLAAGFITYPLLKLFRGEGSKVHVLMYVLGGLILAGYIFVSVYRAIAGS